jgi:hypothetical protein
MAGEIQLNSTTFATESAGTVTVSNVDSATNRQNLGLEIGVDVQQFDADTTKNDVANTFTVNQIISVTDNTNAALRVTQLGTGDALVIEDSTNPDSTPFVVDASGNVGIGTSPSERLDVVVNSTANSRIHTDLGGISSKFVYLTIDSGEIYDDSRALFAFNHGGVQGAGFYTSYRSATGITDGLNVRTYEASPIIFIPNNSEAMRIDSSGALILAGSTAQKATGTTWSNPSDQRLKSNISDYPKGTVELMQVRVREWEYNGKGGTVAGTKGLGVVADEIMTVLPNTVDNYEAKLNVDDEETTQIKKFDATEITWLLVKTTQEQQTLIESQQSQIDALTARIETLETT